MKYIFFFGLIGLFAWAAIVPPEGYSKYPAVTVQVQYDDATKSAQVSVQKPKNKKVEEGDEK